MGLSRSICLTFRVVYIVCRWCFRSNLFTRATFSLLAKELLFLFIWQGAHRDDAETNGIIETARCLRDEEKNIYNVNKGMSKAPMNELLWLGTRLDGWDLKEFVAAVESESTGVKAYGHNKLYF